MKKLTRTQWIVNTYYVFALICAYQVISKSLAASEYYSRAASQLSFSSQGETLLKSLLEKSTLGFYQGGSSRIHEVERLYRQAAEQNLSAWIWGGSFLVLTLIFAVYVVKFVRQDSDSFKQLGIGHLSGISMICFMVGIFSIALSLVAYKDFPVVGMVVFKYEAKGILMTIVSLFGAGQWVIGALIFIFSILFPICKIIATLIANYTPSEELKSRLIVLIKTIGKWSMADVFVVAILLAMFAIGHDEFTDSWVGPGIYFFAIYCLLGLSASHWLIKEKSRES